MAAPQLSADTRQTLAQLQQRLKQAEGAHQKDAPSFVSTGCPAVDRLLPMGGLQRGSLQEYFSAGPSSSHQQQNRQGIGTLAMLLARAAAADGGAVVIVDRGQTFYPPAAAALGIPWRQLLVVRPKNSQDELWTLDQALRSPGVAAVWAPLKQIGTRDFRRLQLAAESSEAIGFLLRDTPWHKQPSWAHVQWGIAAGAVATGASGKHKLPESGRQLNIEVLRVRGAKLNAAVKSVVVQIDEVSGELSTAQRNHHQTRQEFPNHAPHSLHPFPAVADSTTGSGTA